MWSCPPCPPCPTLVVVDVAVDVVVDVDVVVVVRQNQLPPVTVPVSFVLFA